MSLPSDRPRRRALGALCGVLFLTFLDTTIVSVALASIQSDLHADVTQLQWVVNAYALTFASCMLAAGSIADRLGRRRVMIGGLGVFLAGSLLCVFAINPDLLIAGRAIMGIGAAASEPGTLSIIRQIYPESGERARALGYWAAISGLALALGPVIGGALVGIAGFRAVFVFNIVAAIAAISVTASFVPESSDPTPARFDAPGFVAVSIGIAALAFAVILGETNGYASGLVIALFATGTAALIGFVAIERRSPSPILDIGYLRLPTFSGALSLAFVLFFSVFSIFFFAALYLQVVVGYSGYRTAVEFVPMAIAMILASLVAGRIVDRAGPRLAMAIGTALGGVGILLSDLALDRAGAPPGWLAGSLALAGIGFGIGIVPVTSVALSVVPSKHSSMAASATNTSRELGAVFGVGVLGALVNGNLTQSLITRLHALGIPSGFDAIVLGAIETGSLSSSGPGAQRQYGPIVKKVIHAAYGAFRSGLEVALLAAGLTMLAASLIAVTTIRLHRDSDADLSSRA